MNNMTPQETANKRLELAEECLEIGETLTEIELVKPSLWMEIRKKHKSDAQAEREWATTELGQKEIKLRNEYKNKKMLMSALKTKIDVLNMEARNQW